MATAIFMTARIALDRVPDAFAFFCQTSSLAEALEKSLSSRVAVETSSFSHTECDVFRNVSCCQELLVHQVELVCSEFQLLSPKCKVLSQKSCS